MARLASLAVDLQANTAKFKSGMNDAAGVMSKFRSGLGLLRDLSIVTGLNFANLTSAAKRAVQAITNVVNEQRPMIETALNTATAFGMTTEALTSLRFAAGEAGASAEELDAALLPLLRNIEAVAQGAGGPAAKSLERLGLEAKALAAMPLDQRFMVLADAMAKIPTQAERVLHTVNILGKGASNLSNTLAVGSEGIKELMDDAGKLGKVFSSVEAQQVANMNTALARFSKAVDGLKTQITIQLTPFIEEAANAFNRLTTDGRNMGDVVAGAVQEVANGFAALLTVIGAVEKAVLRFQINATAALGLAAKLAEFTGAKGTAGRILGVDPSQLDAGHQGLLKQIEEYEKRIAKINQGGGLGEQLRAYVARVIDQSRARARAAVGDQTEIEAQLDAARARKIAAEQAVADIIEAQNKKLREQAGLQQRYKIGPFALLGGDARFGMRGPSEELTAARTEVRESRVAVAQLEQQKKQTELLGQVNRNLKDPWKNPFAFPGNARAV